MANMEKWETTTWPKEAKGVGLVEAPRGALSHWIVIKDGKDRKLSTSGSINMECFS